MKNKKSQGFTIIEVLIVLAIAGLILLIVFLAVPTLQRNSRNTQRKRDAQSMYAAINEYANNNKGKFPENQDQLNEALKNAGLSFYSANDPVAVYKPASTVNNPRDDTAIVIIGNRCSIDEATNLPDGNSLQGHKDRITILYSIETARGFKPKCFGPDTSTEFL